MISLQQSRDRRQLAADVISWLNRKASVPSPAASAARTFDLDSDWRRPSDILSPLRFHPPNPIRIPAQRLLSKASIVEAHRLRSARPGGSKITIPFARNRL